MHSEALWILAEECGEVVQAASKCQRFGLDGVRPDGSSTNLHHLNTEVGDLLAVVDILIESGVLDPGRLDLAKIEKRAKLLRWSGLQAQVSSVGG